MHTDWRDMIIFALLIGIPLFAIAWVATVVIRYMFGAAAAWAAGGAVVAGWPIYYIAMTFGEPGFTDGMPLLFLTVPPLAAGWIVPQVLAMTKNPI